MSLYGRVVCRTLLFVSAAIVCSWRSVDAQLSSLGPTTSAARTAPSLWPVTPLRRIYVCPFAMEQGLQEQIQQQAASSVIPQGPMRRMMSSRPRAVDMVTGYDRSVPIGITISKQVADELAKAGLPSVIWNNPGPPPVDGWKLSGQIVSLDEGRSVAKDVIGFGVGNKKIGVDIALSDPATAGGQPFFILDSSDKGRKMPGSLALGAVSGFNPYVIAGKLVASHSGISDITQQSRMAGEIAGAVTDALKEHGQILSR